MTDQQMIQDRNELLRQVGEWEAEIASLYGQLSGSALSDEPVYIRIKDLETGLLPLKSRLKSVNFEIESPILDAEIYELEEKLRMLHGKFRRARTQQGRERALKSLATANEKLGKKYRRLLEL